MCVRDDHTGLVIAAGDLADPRILALLEEHVRQFRAITPPGSSHALDLSGLQTPDIKFFAAWDGSQLMGMGALKRLDAAHGEVKSMRTVAAAQRRGVASAMLRHIIAEAHAWKLSRLSLETGSFDFFAPARAFYLRHGFVECPPFPPYRPDPNSVFMTLNLSS
jgi:putative acetyltransferase